MTTEAVSGPTARAIAIQFNTKTTRRDKTMSFTLRQPDKTDLGGIIPNNVDFPEEFRNNFMGEPPSHLAMNLDQDAYELMLDGSSSARRFNPSSSMDSVAAMHYNEMYARWVRGIGVGELPADMQAGLEDVLPELEKYGPGEPTFHLLLKSPGSENRELWAGFPDARFPLVYYSIEDADFLAMANARRADLLSRPFRLRNPLPSMARSASSTIVGFQTECIQNGRAIAEDRVYPSLDGDLKLDNEKLLKALEDATPDQSIEDFVAGL